MPDIKTLRGIELGRAFFQELVEPILTEEFPELSYAAGIIGSGSEVLGFDDEMSSDHHWVQEQCFSCPLMSLRTTMNASGIAYQYAFRTVFDKISLNYNTSCI
jgi:hypothetical protein